jgi:ketosteroid isomerase-like protein
MSAPATGSPQQTVTELFGALDALDVDAVMAMLAAEPQGADELSGGWRRGRAELREYLMGLKEAGLAELRSEVRDAHSVEWGDAAVVTLVLAQTYTLAGVQERISAPTTIVLHREDGAWRVAVVHSGPLAED